MGRCWWCGTRTRGLHRCARRGFASGGAGDAAGLTARQGWSEGRIAATLLYVRTAPSQILRWGTSFPAEVMSRRWGMIPIRAFGRFSVRFEDPQSVAARFARNEVPSDDEVEGRLRRMIAGRFAEALSRLDFADDAGLVAGLNDIDALTERILPDLKAALLRSGIKLIRFLIENLTGPLEVGLKPTSKRAESLNRLGRSLLGDPRDSGPVPTAAVPLVTRAVPSARAALASAEADAVVAPVGGDGAVAEARPVAVPIPSGPVAVPVARVASPEAVPVVRVAGQAVVEAPAQPGRHDTGGLKPIAVPVPVAVGVEVAVEPGGEVVADGVACGSCRAPVPAGARFCMQCGTPQGLRCGSCGSGLPAGARFCSQCGARQG
ncbi:MAG: SPFH domain-containing protein [bacterium]